MAGFVKGCIAVARFSIKTASVEEPLAHEYAQVMEDAGHGRRAAAGDAEGENAGHGLSNGSW